MLAAILNKTSIKVLAQSQTPSRGPGRYLVVCLLLRCNFHWLFRRSDRGKGSEEADYGRHYGRLAARRIHGHSGSNQARREKARKAVRQAAAPIALSSSPNRDLSVSGKFTNGHSGVTRCFNFENTCWLEAGTNPFRVRATYMRSLPL